MPSSEVIDLTARTDPVAAFVEAHHRGADVALPTSGSSGRPRTIVRTTGSWVDSFAEVATLTDLDPTSRVWVPGPPTATMNLFAAVHARWTGAELVSDPARATHVHLTPAVLRHHLATAPADQTGRHLVVAGDRLDVATHERARAAGARVSHYYGAAELSFVAWGAHAEALRPFPGVEIAARRGVLWVRSPFVCRGYLEPEHVLTTDADGWVSVGDRGDAGAGTVTVHGRDGGITTAGATVAVAEVEHALRAGARGEVVVLGLPHPDLGEVVTAVVTDARDLHDLPETARERLAHVQRPRRWHHVHPLPIGTNGKVDRVALRDHLTQQVASR